MEKINLKEVLGAGNPFQQLEKKIARSKEYAKAYLVLIALRQDGNKFLTAKMLADLLVHDNSFTNQMLNFFKSTGIVTKIGNRTWGVKYPFTDLIDQDADYYIKAAKECIGIQKISKKKEVEGVKKQ